VLEERMDIIFAQLITLFIFVLLFLLIVALRWPAIRAMPIVWLVAVVAALFIWEMPFRWIAASFIRGSFITVEIMLIIFGAVLLVTFLANKGMLAPIQSMISSVSPDARVQAIIVAWIFGSLIEGIAGFGVPAAIVAPILVSLGFSPMIAIVISLVANSTAVSFGAAGTPVTLGIGALGFSPSVVQEVAANAALLHLIASFMIPLMVVYLVVTFSKESGKGSFYEAVPFAILSWLAFSVPYFLTAKFIGPELPSIIGSLTALLVVGLAARYKFLTPKNVLDFQPKKTGKKASKKNILFSVMPYMMIVVLLLLTRTVPFIRRSLGEVALSAGNILGVQISYDFLPLYTPSFYFLLVCAISALIFGMTRKEVSHAALETFHKVKKPFIALIFTLAIVQLMIASGNNGSGLPSMPLTLALGAVDIAGGSFTLVSPFVGILGSFIAGSNTVSNLLFGSFQASSAQALSLPVAWILALQVVGGAVGNMIAIHNILAAQAIFGMHGQEGRIIRKTILPCLIYGAIVAIAGTVLILIL
jgi:lactate permease